MDHIAEHMALLEKLKQDESIASHEKLADVHQTAILAGYKALMEELELVLEKHLPGLLERDAALDRDCAEQDKRAPMPENILFLTLTSQYLLIRVEQMVARWAIKKLGTLSPAPVEVTDAG